MNANAGETKVDSSTAAADPGETCKSGGVLSVDESTILLRGMLDDAGHARRRLLSPFEVHFSQALIRPEFQDGTPVDDSVKAIGHRSCVTRGDIDGAPDGTFHLLQPPFPEIEVIQWRCKLRDQFGDITVDMYGNELHGDLAWYSLDNRRLYCLQKAAAALHPTEVRVLVCVVTQDQGNCREFRKFRTPDLGRTIGIGYRDGGLIPRWSWREEVGLPPLPPPSGSAIDRPGKKRSSRQRQQESEEDENGGGHDMVKSAVMFMLVYVLLRIVFYMGRRLSGGVPASTQMPSGTSSTEL